MSDLSEQIFEITEEIVKAPEDGGPPILVRGLNGSNEIPGIKENMEIQKGIHTKLLRKCKQWFTGAEWGDAESALVQVSEHLQKDAISCVMKTLAAGMCVGETPKYWSAENFNELFESEEFRDRMMIGTLPALLDRDVVDVVRDQLVTALGAMSELFGVMNMSPKEIGHIWDVWYGALGSTSMSMYGIGVVLGQKKVQDEIFANFEVKDDHYDS